MQVTSTTRLYAYRIETYRSNFQDATSDWTSCLTHFTKSLNVLFLGGICTQYVGEARDRSFQKDEISHRFKQIAIALEYLTYILFIYLSSNRDAILLQGHFRVNLRCYFSVVFEKSLYPKTSQSQKRLNVFVNYIYITCNFKNSELYFPKLILQNGNIFTKKKLIDNLVHIVSNWLVSTNEYHSKL